MPSMSSLPLLRCLLFSAHSWPREWGMFVTPDLPKRKNAKFGSRRARSIMEVQAGNGLLLLLSSFSQEAFQDPGDGK